MKLYTSQTAKHTAIVTRQYREGPVVDAIAERRALVLKITRRIRTIENAIKSQQKRQRRAAAAIKGLRAELKGQKLGLDVALQQNETIATELKERA